MLAVTFGACALYLEGFFGLALAMFIYFGRRMIRRWRIPIGKDSHGNNLYGFQTYLLLPCVVIGVLALSHAVMLSLDANPAYAVLLKSKAGEWLRSVAGWTAAFSVGALVGTSALGVFGKYLDRVSVRIALGFIAGCAIAVSSITTFVCL
jgi:hypothetical protein